MKKKRYQIMILLLFSTMTTTITARELHMPFFIPIGLLEIYRTDSINSEKEQESFDRMTIEQYIETLLLNEENKAIDSEEVGEEPIEEPKKTITLSAVGDITLGSYYGQSEWNRFDLIATEKGYHYFLDEVRPIFEGDDLTIANLEGPLTTGGQRVEKEFAMRGEPSYTEILNHGSIEAVGLANNHTYDYGIEGYRQTIEALEEAGIHYFEEDFISYQEINGIQVGLISYKAWESGDYTKNQISLLVQEAKTQADLVIIMFHWGEEGKNYPNTTQKTLAYHAIDEGVDLVVGSHPHVIQGIEMYKEKKIVYSLGNFCFGGNRNPSDKATFIYQETFELTEEGIVSINSAIIPCRISSVTNLNNYQPMLLEGDEGNEVLERLKTYSEGFTTSYFH